jgi:hypothetical protein
VGLLEQLLPALLLAEYMFCITFLLKVVTNLIETPSHPHLLSSLFRKLLHTYLLFLRGRLADLGHLILTLGVALVLTLHDWLLAIMHVHGVGLVRPVYCGLPVQNEAGLVFVCTQ